MRFRQTVLVASSIVILTCACAAARSSPGTADTIQKAADPYSWLEGQHEPAATEWAKRQRDRALADIESSPTFPAVQRELHSELEIGAPLPDLFVLGNRLLRFTRDVRHPPDYSKSLHAATLLIRSGEPSSISRP